MKIDFPAVIEKKTVGVSERGFGTILIYDPDAVQDYTIITQETLKDLGKGTKAFKLAQRLFMQSPAPTEVAYFGGEDIEEVAGRDFYWIVSTDNSIERIEEIGNFAAVNRKVYVVTTNTIEDTQSLFDEVNERVAVVFHDDIDSFAAEALSVVMSYKPGEKTGKFRQLNGVKEANVTDTFAKALEDNNINTYVKKLGVLQMTEGKVLSGEYIDIILTEDWIRFRIEERMMHLALNNDKIPYTNQGIAMMIGVVESVLKEAESKNMIMPGQYVIDYKRREEVSSNEAANRDYNHIKWAATLAGAIHEGTIYGVLTNDIVKEVE